MPNPTPAPVQPAEMTGEIILTAENITKIFPGTVALDDVSFKVRRGKVNVLIGENGAGKSTLMKILAGVEQPTSGKILLDGREIHLHSPLDATRLGIGIIYQELNLCPNLSVADNIFLAREMTRNGLIERKSQKLRARELVGRLEQKIDPNELLGDLRIGEQQIVEIAKALAQDVQILIMDEPTSALSVAEVEVLFRVIRELKSHGVAIIYISHKLEELLQIGDYITILRDGRKVAEDEAKNVSVPWMIEQMDIGFMRSLARAPSEISMRSAPRILSDFAPPRTLSTDNPRGKSISTVMMNFLPSLRASSLGSLLAMGAFSFVTM